MENVPAPLTGLDCDLRDFGWMPLEVGRLRDSDFVVIASGDAFRAAVLLWCASWHQVPAASLPNDDRLLANLAGYGRDLRAWQSVRDDALRGFILCSDGRLYHPVVAEKAIEAASLQEQKRRRTEAATAARRNGKRNDQRDDARNDAQKDQRDVFQQTGPEQTEQDRKSSSRSVAKATRLAANEKFEEFWQAYPRRQGDNPRSTAEKKFNALVKTGLAPEMLIAAIKQYAIANAAKVGTPYIPQAVTWLNQARWSDHAAVAAVSALAAEPGLSLEQAVAQYAKLGIWSRHAPCGEPGSLSCTAPAELLAKYGLDPIGRKLPPPLDDEPLEPAA